MRQLFHILSTIPLLIFFSGYDAEVAAAAGTYYVGTCKPGKAEYTTITSAISKLGTAIPTGSTIDVCPGIYHEQVTITQPVTLQAVQIGDSSQVVIAGPASAPVSTVSTPDNLIALVTISNSAGPVTLKGLTIDGTGLVSSGGDIAGIFYDSSPGVINEVIVQNFSAPSQSGYNVSAISVRDDSSLSPAVTVENSSISFPNGASNTSYIGIDAGFGATSTAMALTLSNNVISNATAIGISITNGTATVTGNLIVGMPGSESEGIFLGTFGSVKVSNNSITNFSIGLSAAVTQSAPSTITGNFIAAYDEDLTLLLSSANVSVTGNEFVSLPNAPNGQGAVRQVGVDISCSQNPTMSGNKFIGNLIALDNVPAGESLQNSAGTYIGVPSVEALCN